MNQREIKFRAWLKPKKQMVYFRFRDLARVDKGLFAYIEDKDERMWCIDCDDMDHDFIMQFTGLKDKNGKEIYEGDIVKVNMFSLNGKFEMKWHDNGFWLDYKDNCWELPNKEFREVIGNIYETRNQNLNEYSEYNNNYWSFK